MDVQILTIDEVRNTLRLDSDFPETVLEDIVVEATAYVDNKTDHEWEGDETIHPLAKAACRYKAQMLFYHDSEHDFQKTVDGLCEDLKDVLRKAEEES